MLFFRNPGSVVTFLKRSKRNPIFNKSTDHKEYRQQDGAWSHQKALEYVFFAQKGKLFECFIDTLDECQSVDHSRETITDAEALEIKLTSFETVLTAHVFNKIFSITDPASLYLQLGKIDLLTAIRLIETAESQLEKLRGGI